jgi:hypothetical protein
MNWQLTGDILLGLGIVLVVIGLLLRFKVGRWLLGGLLVLLTLASLFSGDWSDPGSSVDSDPMKVSRWLLIIGGGCLLIALFIRFLHQPVS